MLRKMPERTGRRWSAEERQRLCWISLILLFWVAVSGIGGIAFQNEDHAWRNAMFEMLVEEKWPVIRTVTVDGIAQTRGYSYYMGFWLIPALAGKLFGLQSGYYFQILWAYIGILLFYYGICILRGKIEIWPLLVFIFFSGADIVGWYLSGISLSEIEPTQHLEWWTQFQFTSTTAQLFWVFNQAIPAWLVTVLLCLQRDNRCIALLLAVSAISCILPVIGMVPICLYRMFAGDYGEKRFRASWWKRLAGDSITVENVLCGGVVGILSCLFLLRAPGGEGNGVLIELRNGGWLIWLVSLLVEVGGFFAAVYCYQKRNPLLYVLLAWLCLCPVLNVYGGDNFCMRASIPALILLYLYVTDALERSLLGRKWLSFLFLLAVLTAGAVTPMHEIKRTISETERIYTSSGQQTLSESVGTDRVLGNVYESVDTGESVFYRFLAG